VNDTTIYSSLQRHEPNLGFCLAMITHLVPLMTKRLLWSRGSALAFGTQVRGFTNGQSRWIFRAKKNPQHAFLRRGCRAVGPMS